MHLLESAVLKKSHNVAAEIHCSLSLHDFQDRKIFQGRKININYLEKFYLENVLIILTSEGGWLHL